MSAAAVVAQNRANRVARNIYAGVVGGFSAAVVDSVWQSLAWCVGIIVAGNVASIAWCVLVDGPE